MSGKKLSRRQMLKGLGLTAMGAAAAACQPKTVIVKEEVTVKETVIVAGTPQTVEKVVTATPVPAEVPNIYFARATGCEQGSDPEKLKAVQDVIQEATGVRVHPQLLPMGSGGTEKLNLLLASATQPLDLFTGAWPNFKGIILPMNDLLDQYGQDMLAGHPDYDWALMKDAEGTTWGYPRLGAMSHTHYTYIRQDWLQEVGILDDWEWTHDPIPRITNVVTWQQLRDAIEAMHEAHPEAVVFSDRIGHLRMNTMGAWTEYGFSRFLDSDGMITPAEVQPDFGDWLAEMNDIWDRGWFLPENFGSTDVRGLLKSLTVSTYWGWYSRMSGWWPQIQEEAGYTTEEYLRIDQLEGPKGLAKTNNVGSQSCYMIPRKSKHPEAVIKFTNWVYGPGRDGDPTPYMITRSGVEGSEWEWVDKGNRIAKNLQAYDTHTGLPTNCGQMYNMDFNNTLGLGPESWYANVAWEDPKTGEPVTSRHLATIFHYDTEAMDWGKTPVDGFVPYDTKMISDKFPGVGDIGRILSEEAVRFITGERVISAGELDGFRQQLEDAGLEQWQEAYTEQYRQFNP